MAEPPAKWLANAREMAAQLVAKRVIDDGPLAIDRPLGAEPIPMEAQARAYDELLANPSLIVQQLNARAGQIGLRAATIEMIEWAEKVRQFREKNNG